MSRLREGRANTARGAAHFLRETAGRMRYGGARGQLTVRADSGFYAHTVVAACREMDVRFSITIRQRASLRDLIEAIPEEDWTPIRYWMDGAADGGTDHPLGAPPHFASPPRRWPWETQFSRALARLQAIPFTRSARRLTLHLPRRWPWETQFSRALARLQARPDGQPATDPTSPQSRATPVARVPCCVSSRHPAHRNSRIGP